jgi:hypothetical protein
LSYIKFYLKWIGFALPAFSHKTKKTEIYRQQSAEKQVNYPAYIALSPDYCSNKVFSSQHKHARPKSSVQCYLCHNFLFGYAKNNLMQNSSRETPRNCIFFLGICISTKVITIL